MNRHLHNLILAAIVGCVALPILVAMLAGAALPVGVAKTGLPRMVDSASGSYRNPVLAGDYSDPDVVRVGDDFYLVSSSFVNVPGLPILHSKDLVHWRIVGHALAKLAPVAHYRTPRHGGGVWAPAIRHHDGKFVIFFPDPDFGIFRIDAADPAGPWSEPVQVDDTKGAIDPAPFWDDDGQGWLVHAFARSRAGISNVIVLKRLNAEGTKTVGSGIPIIDGAKLPDAATGNGKMPWLTTEGPKLYKRGGWYYVFAPSGSVPGGWQGVFRARTITGPYEGRDVLDQGSTDINGPHQGAWVTTDSGEDWFLHFQDTGAYGRRVWLEPMIWKDGWPIIGRDAGHIGRGEPVSDWRMPNTAPSVADTPDDEFNGTLGLGWQWGANPEDDWADLRSNPGSLRLHSVSSPANLWEDGAILTQKLPGERFMVTTKLTAFPKAVGERGGLVMYGMDYAWIGLERAAHGLRLVLSRCVGASQNEPETQTVLLADAPETIYLRLSAEPVTVAVPPPGFTPFWPSMLKTRNASVHFSYSIDGTTFMPVGMPFEAKPGKWVGGQVGIFAQAPSGSPSNTAVATGWTDFDWFRVEH